MQSTDQSPYGRVPLPPAEHQPAAEPELAVDVWEEDLAELTVSISQTAAAAEQAAAAAVRAAAAVEQAAAATESPPPAAAVEQAAAQVEPPAAAVEPAAAEAIALGSARGRRSSRPSRRVRWAEAEAEAAEPTAAQSAPPEQLCSCKLSNKFHCDFHLAVSAEYQDETTRLYNHIDDQTYLRKRDLRWLEASFEIDKQQHFFRVFLHRKCNPPLSLVKVLACHCAEKISGSADWLMILKNKNTPVTDSQLKQRTARHFNVCDYFTLVPGKM